MDKMYFGHHISCAFAKVEAAHIVFVRYVYSYPRGLLSPLVKVEIRRCKIPNNIYV